MLSAPVPMFFPGGYLCLPGGHCTQPDFDPGCCGILTQLLPHLKTHPRLFWQLQTPAYNGPSAGMAALSAQHDWLAFQTALNPTGIQTQIGSGW